MKKTIYLLYIIATLIFINSAYAAAPLLKTVALSGTDSRDGVNYYDRDQTPTFIITINATSNFTAICNDVDTFTAASACNENVTTGCVAVGVYTATATSKTIRYTPTVTEGSTTIYCAACNKGAACDKTAITGSNAVTFYVRKLKSNVMSFSSILIIIAMGMGAFYGFKSGKINASNIVVVMATLLLAAILVITIFNT